MKKGDAYHGKTTEELQTLSTQEFSKILTSRQRRSLKRGSTPEQKKLLTMIQAVHQGKHKKPVKTHCRDMIILPDMIGQLIQVHNGKEFTPIAITYDMIGHYLGEFSPTRRKVQHSAPGIGATKSSGSLSVK